MCFEFACQRAVADKGAPVKPFMPAFGAGVWGRWWNRGQRVSRPDVSVDSGDTMHLPQSGRRSAKIADDRRTIGVVAVSTGFDNLPAILSHQIEI